MLQVSINVNLLKMERRSQAITLLSNYKHRSHTGSFLMDMPELEPGMLSKGPATECGHKDVSAPQQMGVGDTHTRHTQDPSMGQTRF